MKRLIIVAMLLMATPVAGQVISMRAATDTLTADTSYVIAAYAHDPYQAYHAACRISVLLEETDFHWFLIDEYKYAIRHQDWIEIRQIARLLTWADERNSPD